MSVKLTAYFLEIKNNMIQQNTEILKQVIGLFDGDTDPRPVLVTVRCITYNQEPYIRAALESFVMQKTNFRFEVIVHDDASTDNTASILREYAEKYPGIIVPIYEEENQYSKRNGSIGRIMMAATRGKYTALCEGDDYWTDPLKLQKQVDFLEAHPEYSMCWTNAVDLDPDGSQREQNRYGGDTDSPISDIITKGGAFISTASICFKSSIYKSMPIEVRSQYVGDFPLQIYLAYIGKIRYLHDLTTVYRRNSIGSFTQRNSNISAERILANMAKEMKLIQAMDSVTEHKFTKCFELYKNTYLWKMYRNLNDLSNECKFFLKLKHPMDGASWKFYVYSFLRYTRLMKVLNKLKLYQE
jgi:glycosyltransferase involved in cell wall biosynthesis